MCDTDKKGGCWCEKPQANKRCQYSPKVRKLIEDLNKAVIRKRDTKKGETEDDLDKPVTDGKAAVDEAIKKCNKQERVWCMTNRDCKGEMSCWNQDKSEFFADAYQRCSGENGDGGTCFCKRQKRGEGEIKFKEGHEGKACMKVENGDWENPKKNPSCCAKQGEGHCSTGYYMDWAENPEECGEGDNKGQVTTCLRNLWIEGHDPEACMIGEGKQ